MSCGWSSAPTRRGCWPPCWPAAASAILRLPTPPCTTSSSASPARRRRTAMRKMLVVAAREYQAAVRTKAFVIGLLIMPLLMGGSILVQYLLKDIVDTTTKRYALINRFADQRPADAIVAAVNAYNQKHTDSQGRQVKPRIELELLKPEPEDTAQRYELSEQVRKGKLAGFVEILGGDALPTTGAPADVQEALGVVQKPYVTLRYESNRPTDRTFAEMARLVVGLVLQKELTEKTKLSEPEQRVVMNPVALRSKGLTV